MLTHLTPNNSIELMLAFGKHRMSETLMTYRIEQDESTRSFFGDYNYLIYRGDKLVARYWHDYRGDDYGKAIKSRNEALSIASLIRGYSADSSRQPSP